VQKTLTMRIIRIIIYVSEVCVMRFRELEKIIQDDGWHLVKTVGSHFQYKHETKPGKVTIPKHTGDIPPITVKSILKQAGLQ